MTSRIEELAQAVSTSTGRVGDYLRSQSLPFPSFDADGPVEATLKDAQIEQARQDAMASCLELFSLLQGPRMCLRPCYNAAPMHAIYKFEIAQKVPLVGEISFTDLASQCGLYEPDLRRIVRFAIVYHRAFLEPRKGYVAHSAASRQLVEDPDVRDGIGLMFDDFYQSFARTVDALQTFPGQEPNQTGWALAHNSTHQSTFSYLADNPSRAARFSGAMKFFSSTVPGNAPSHLLEAFPWGDLGAATVVDVGGADGYVSMLLAQSFPELQITVEDLPHISQEGKVPPALKERVEFKAQDFFQEQNVKGADVYLLRWVLHDWPDKYAIEILRALVPALKNGARVLINDNVGPGQAGLMPLIPEQFVRELDMIMLAAFNAYERELEDWERLVKDADPRFGPVKYTQQSGALLGVLEIEWLGG